MIIDRYLWLSMIRGGIPILGMLLGLFAFLTLAEELEDVGKGQFEVIDAIRVMALSLPKITLDLLPVTSLVAVLVGLGTLASSQELIALNSAGWSNFRLARPVVSIALLIIAGAAASQQWVIPILEREIADLRANTIDQAHLEDAGSEFWTRSDNHIVRIGGVRFGLMPTDVEIYTTDSAGHLTQLLQAGRAQILSKDKWQLHDVEITRIFRDGTTFERHDLMEWDNVLDVDQMASIISSASALPITDLIEYIAHLKSNDLDSHRYRLVLWQQLSLPLGILGMALLGIPFVVGSMRAIPVGTRISIGIVVGILFYLVERTTGQLALLYNLPPIPLAVAPDLIILGIAVIALKRAR